MYLPTIPMRCMEHRFIPIHLSTIRLPATMRREWRFHLESDLPWEPRGAAGGAGDAGGAETTTSTSITTIISSATPMLMVATATTLETETAHRINRHAGMEISAEN